MKRTQETEESGEVIVELPTQLVSDTIWANGFESNGRCQPFFNVTHYPQDVSLL